MSRWARALHTETDVALLDLDVWVGQRSESYRFYAVDAVTGYREEVNPISDRPPILSHDTSRVITRDITGLYFGKRDTALLNSIRTRLLPVMVVGGVEYPLGTYLYNTQARLQYSSGTLSAGTFYDQMFVVDQQTQGSFGPSVALISSAFPQGQPVMPAILDLLAGLPIQEPYLESSNFFSVGTWGPGTYRGAILGQLAIDGNYFAPTFRNNSRLYLTRVFDPATATARFDFDTGNKILADPVPIETDDLITAPNRIIVIGNGSLTTATTGAAISGSYDIPASAPHSIANRGFVIPQIEYRQVQDSSQAAAVARDIGERQTIFERIEVYTAPDPRHDAYDVIRLFGENWLELGWSLTMQSGAPMRHVLRKAYSS